jgi:hypothetical protein
LKLVYVVITVSKVLNFSVKDNKLMTSQSKFRWGFGVFFFLMGLLFFTVNWFLGLIFVFLGVIFIPYGNEKALSLAGINKQNNESIWQTAKKYNTEVETPLFTTSYEYSDITDDEPTPTKPKKKFKPKSSDGLDTIKFKYKDYEGNITERVVDFHTGKRGDIFKGFCHLREENRTFYYSRIAGMEVINVNTGEVMKPMEWRYSIQGTKLAEQAMLDEQEI